MTFLVSACGQPGPLYLPVDSTTVKTKQKDKKAATESENAQTDQDQPDIDSPTDQYHPD